MKRLTIRYSFTQFFYWTAICGGGSFATIFLLNKGMPSGMVGILLAVAGLLSSLTQPVIASAADRSEKFILPQVLMGMAAICCACYALQLLPGIPLVLNGLFYALAIWSGGAMSSLVSALSVGYDKAGYSINYGIGRGIGAVATAVSALILGIMIAELGTAWMLTFVSVAWMLFLFAVAGYPRIDKSSSEGTDVKNSCSIAEFFARYRWYCVSLLGVLFMGMYHTMTESYMIAIMNRLGGDSSHVGTALFISAIVTFPVICIFSRIRSRIQITSLLKIAAVSYAVKAVCFCFTKEISLIYLFQLIQITSYAFLEPSQVFYAKEKIHMRDMAKGQAFIAASYALGGSAGNFIGGQLLGFGVQAILIAGIIMALGGVGVIFSTVNKSDL